MHPSIAKLALNDPESRVIKRPPDKANDENGSFSKASVPYSTVRGLWNGRDEELYYQDVLAMGTLPLVWSTDSNKITSQVEAASISLSAYISLNGLRNLCRALGSCSRRLAVLCDSAQHPMTLQGLSWWSVHT